MLHLIDFSLQPSLDFHGPETFEASRPVLLWSVLQSGLSDASWCLDSGEASLAGVSQDQSCVSSVCPIRQYMA